MQDIRTTRSSDQFQLRLPTGLRARIKAAADSKGRSMNSEIVATLESAYPEPLQDQEAFALLRFMLDAESPEDLQARKVEVDAKLAAMGSSARVLEGANFPPPGKVAIVKNPR